MVVPLFLLVLSCIKPVQNIEWGITAWNEPVTSGTSGSTPWFSNFAVLSERKLLVCVIDGNAPALFMDILCSLSKHHHLYAEVDKNRENGFEHGCDDTSMLPMNQAIGSELGLNYLLSDYRWTKAIWYREPLERFVSLWQHACPHNSKSVHSHSLSSICYKIFGSKAASFDSAIEFLNYSNIKSESFRRQSEYCHHSVRNASIYYNHIYPLTPSFRGGYQHALPSIKLRNNERVLQSQVKEVLGDVGISLPHTEPGFRYHFPNAVNLTAPWRRDDDNNDELFQSKKQRKSVPHVLSWRSDIAPVDVSSFYTKESTQIVLKHYASDYLSFNIPAPKYAVALVGPTFVQDLGISLPPEFQHDIQHRTHSSSDSNQRNSFIEGKRKHKIVDSFYHDKSFSSSSTGLIKRNGLVSYEAPNDDDHQVRSSTLTSPSTHKQDLQKQSLVPALIVNRKPRVIPSREVTMQRATQYRCHLAQSGGRIRDGEKCKKALLLQKEKDLSHYRH